MSGRAAEPVGPGPARGRSGIGWLAGGVVAGAAAALGIVVLVESLTSGQPATATRPPRFVQEAAAAGVHHVYDGDSRFFVGGGVATFDCDDDGRPDLYLAGGANPATLYRNESPIGGALRFERVTDRAADLTDVVGAYPIDVDGDGRTDLAVLRIGENVLLRGLGDCRFHRANEAWGFDGGHAWTTAFSATWEGSDALPTLAFGNYLDGREGREQARCADNVLMRPRGAGYDRPTRLAPGWCALSMLFSDWDRSGRTDLRVSNDRQYYVDGEEQLWRIVPGEAPRPYTPADGWQRVQIWGMGIASYDVDGDGLPEVFLTSQGDNKLQTLAGGAARPTYRDIALSAGVTAQRPYAGGDPRPSTAWHAEFQDVNDDGIVDLFVSKGNVSAMPEFAAKDPSDLLLGRSDGTFAEGGPAAGLVSFDRGRGAAVVDLNLDGMLDIVQVNLGTDVQIWRNVGSGSAEDPVPMGNWIALRLEQPGPDRDAIGAWIEVRSGDRTTRRELTIGGGHASGELGWIHFGLGSADRAEIRVTWPDGEVGPWLELAANRFGTIERGSDAPRIWMPADAAGTG